MNNKNRIRIAHSILGTVLSLLLVAELQADERDFPDLEKFIVQEAADKKLPMLSIILVDDDGVAWSFGVGEDANNPNLIADRNTTYRIGSVSKLFTDIAVMQLVEKGELDLDEPVSSYLPEFLPHNPYVAPITLRLLMSHSSGLVREPPVGNYFATDEPTLEQTVQSLNDTTLVYAPGSKVQYSNAGIAVVGRVLEQLSGQDFAEVLGERTLQPLEMSHSAFSPEDRVTANLPSAYMWSYQGDRTVAPTFELGMSPAGSMYSTMNDLALFMDALIGRGQSDEGQILQEQTLDQMWTPQSDISSGRNRSFGIGFNLSTLDGERTVAHGGAIYGFSTQLKILPDKRIGVAIATNLDMANGTIEKIADYALRVLIADQERRPVPEFNITQAVRAKYAQNMIGRYRHGNETVDIMQRFGDLYIERIGGLSLRLRETEDQIVIDDQMGYRDDFSYSDGEVTLANTVYSRVDVQEPAPVDRAWIDLIGEYGWDHNVLFISEKFGTLHALIEWGMEYPLTDLGNETFRFPSYGLYPNESLVFERNDNGSVTSASLNGIGFTRRAVGDIDGDVFQINPVRPVAELERDALQASPPTERGEFYEADLVDITAYSEKIKLDIRYANTDNFLGVPVYSSAKAFLQRPAAESLQRISAKLETMGYGLLVHDAYRPWYVSKIFWDATPEESKRFVADPSQGSRHNRGCAIDLTLYDLKTGQPIEMVGLYDEMSGRSYPHYPGGSSLQRWHRELLRDAMEAEGFTVYEYEWWHFDYDGWENYRIQTETFESLR